MRRLTPAFALAAKTCDLAGALGAWARESDAQAPRRTRARGSAGSDGGEKRKRAAGADVRRRRAAHAHAAAAHAAARRGERAGWRAHVPKLFILLVAREQPAEDVNMRERDELVLIELHQMADKRLDILFADELEELEDSGMDEVVAQLVLEQLGDHRLEAPVLDDIPAREREGASEAQQPAGLWRRLVAAACGGGL